MLAKFIDSLHVHFYNASIQEVIHPVFINGKIEKHNQLIMLNRGHLMIGSVPGDYLPEHSIYFYPSGKPVFMRHGQGDHQDSAGEGYPEEKNANNFFRKVNISDPLLPRTELITVVAFDVMLYEAIPFFEVLDIPAFALAPSVEMDFLIRHIVLEHEQEKLGRDKIIRNYINEIVIHLCRFLEAKADYKKYIDKLDFLTDRRLIDIVKYIRENLGKDLSNKTLANVAHISEDYVGQFFKSLTGKNLQDYIESQRLERALNLLKSQPFNIQEIAHRVGFKDPAYFSRRFKMKFGANANSVRQHKVIIP